MIDWRPSASIAMLQKRAALLAYLRAFFAERGAMEVDAPAITATAVTDPNIESLAVNFAQRADFDGSLITSPEFYMKRLLAAGSGDIYSLNHAFRADESGSRHHREFMLLEWYRCGWSIDMLMQEVEVLVRGVLDGAVQYLTYRDAFMTHTGLDPFFVSVDVLKKYAQEKLSPAFDSDDRDLWLDLLFSHLVEPQLRGLVFLTQFPAAQAALAQTELDEYGNAVASRFELYIDGVEMANGYQEELNTEVLRERFLSDQQKRAQRSQHVPALDERFLAAMVAGLPPCAGVALGVDRLLMALCGEKKIRAVVSFLQ
ncbi:MAG: EF-P lysine aminoacylase EpmA [Pseudomonadales bacterium]